MHESRLRRALRRHVPFWVGRALRAAYYYPGDLRDTLLGRRPAMQPPRATAAFVGDGDFAGMGRRFLEHFVTLGGLRPTDHVLDIGCGAGRMAVPLTTFLSPDAIYRGFDPVAEGIEWCRTHITSRHPNFEFSIADVWSRAYNRRGRTQAGKYVFPYEDASFDFVFATSVFTHMTPDGVENYLRNIARLLRPGGRSFATFFLLNEDTRRSPAAADFRYPVDAAARCLAVSPREYEKAVAFDESFLRGLYRACGLAIREPVRYGRWATRNGGPAFQDIVVAGKA